MDELREVLDKARALGEALAAHPRMRDYTAARQAVAGDTNAQDLLKSYSEQAEHIRRLEATQQPVEVADKQKIAEIEKGMAANEALKRLMRSQADYIELMNRVNEAMEAPLAPTQQADPSA